MEEKVIEHQFLLEPGVWLGEGSVSFSASNEAIQFHSRWNIFNDGETANTQACQEVELVGVPDKVINKFVISNPSSTGFVVELSNDMIQKVQGVGIIDGSRIAWEFRGEQGFEGYEVYDCQEDGSYVFHAEYLSSEQFRTMIDGRIWKKES